MRRILSKRFFDRPTLIVAKDLIGKFLVHRIGRRTTAGMITEVEAYVGPRDLASHASRGRTDRNSVMFGEPGHWYVYLIYGMHHCLNIVTEREGYPAAVLIRSIIHFQRSSVENGIYGVGRKIEGPGRVCRYFRIDRRLNKKPAKRASGLWIEDRVVKINPHTKFGVGVNPRRIIRGKRIGVEYAGKWKEKQWRFSVG